MTSLAAVKVGDSIQTGLDAFFGFLPNLIGFLVILLIAFIVARIVKAALSKGLEKAGLDRALKSGQTGQYVEKVSPNASPSNLIGRVGFWAIFLIGLTIAIGALKIPALTAFLDDVLAFLPNIIVAILIFVAAGVIAGAVGALVARTMGDTPTGKLVGSVVPVLVLGIAFFMILNQLNIAQEIVTITYTALIGATALGLALAFGLGGRPVAQRMLEDAYTKGQEQRGQVKRDLELGKERGQRDAQRAKEKAESQVDGGSAGSSAGGARPAGA